MRRDSFRSAVQPLTRAIVAFSILSLALTALTATAPAAHAQLSFTLGIGEDGELDIANTSATPGFTLDGLAVSFAAASQTFFDTADTLPGITPRSFGIFVNNGVTTITLPDDAATDGRQTAFFGFSGFDAGDSAGLSFDLDSFGDPDEDGVSIGDVEGGFVSALFSNGQTVNGIIVRGSFAPIFDEFPFGVTASAPVAGAPIPEPGAVAVSLSLLSMTGIGMLRGRLRARRGGKAA